MNKERLAILGTGASAIYILKHIVDHLAILQNHIGRIELIEKSDLPGMGMPYSPRTTDRFHRSNISSAELPELPRTLVDWLHDQDDETLSRHHIKRDLIRADEVYSRLTLGEYLHAQYDRLQHSLRTGGVEVIEHCSCEILDLIDDPQSRKVLALTSSRGVLELDRIVIATGHEWPKEDRPAEGYYSCPWPIFKLFPDEGKHHNFETATIGASLSAFDVISSLAHRHGTFHQTGSRLRYEPDPGTERFTLVMHSAEGQLPHLQYDQVESQRKIYRHIDRDSLLSLRDENGFLRLSTFFDRVCRPALCNAFQKDQREDLAQRMNDPDFGLPEFVETLSREHHYPDAFEGLRKELEEAESKNNSHTPTHWKEVIDDLIYCLNYHAELMAAEDHIQFSTVLMPFQMSVIAALPLHSAYILLALHEAGKLKLIPGRVEVRENAGAPGRTGISIENDGEERRHTYRMLIDCSGQKSVGIDEFPFATLAKNGGVRSAFASFADPGTIGEIAAGALSDKIGTMNGEAIYFTGGVDIDASYHLVGKNGESNPRIFDIAFPHTAGVRPYSYGLQACNATAAILVESLVESLFHSFISSGVTEVSRFYKEM